MKLREIPTSLRWVVALTISCLLAGVTLYGQFSSWQAQADFTQLRTTLLHRPSSAQHPSPTLFALSSPSAQFTHTPDTNHFTLTSGGLYLFAPFSDHPATLTVGPAQVTVHHSAIIWRLPAQGDQPPRTHLTPLSGQVTLSLTSNGTTPLTLPPQSHTQFPDYALSLLATEGVYYSKLSKEYALTPLSTKSKTLPEGWTDLHTQVTDTTPQRLSWLTQWEQFSLSLLDRFRQFQSPWGVDLPVWGGLFLAQPHDHPATAHLQQGVHDLTTASTRVNRSPLAQPPQQTLTQWQSPAFLAALDSLDLQSDWQLYHQSETIAQRTQAPTTDNFSWLQLSLLSQHPTLPDRTQQVLRLAQAQWANGQTARTSALLEHALTDIFSTPTGSEAFTPAQLTHTRRQLSWLLTSDPQLITPTLTGLYRQLVTAEVTALAPTPALQDEHRLENARSILYLLKLLLQRESNITLSRELLSLYDQLEISTIESQLGRTIFNDDERETIAFIDLVGSSGLTKADIEAIQQAKADQQALEASLAALQSTATPSATTPDTPDAPSPYPLTADTLTQLLSATGLRLGDTPPQTITTVTPPLIRWEGTYSPLSLPAAVSYTAGSPRLTFIRVGETSTSDLPLDLLGAWLDRLTPADPAPTPERNLLARDFLTQTSREAILQRKVAQAELAASTSLTITLEQVTLLDPEGKAFQVTDALWAQGIPVSFRYQPDRQLLTDLTAQVGPQLIEAHRQRWPLSRFDDKFQTLLNENTLTE